ncbi:MAG: ribonucleotide-diphosphate reductase subunit alpha, partial [Chloroflexi bacterium]|nr:ribonucleotide-diphosphate reductase subunit alpha [Chloroflexota bacterium]
MGTKSNKRSKFEPAQISDNAMVVLNKRYLRKNEKGEVTEDPQGMFRRVANALASVEKQYGTPQADIDEVAERFYRSMASLEYVPNSPTLMNAGTGAGTLSACFVLPLYDSMQSIMDCAADAAMVQKFGGGTGFALSHIRPKGTAIRTTHGKACGPIAVLRHLSSVSTLVTQGGKRDGANMAVMDVHHPDILEFIDCKKVEGQIHNFNISVGASDEFMRAVEAGTDYPLRFRKNPADPKSDMVEAGRLDARTVFHKIVEGAWRNGEPGMVFLDEVNRDSPVLHVGPIEATNPCGEQPLLP